MRTTNVDGEVVSVPPGEYTLSETKDARYELVRHAEKSTSLSLWFAELLLCAYTGQVEILGVWP